MKILLCRSVLLIVLVFSLSVEVVEAGRVAPFGRRAHKLRTFKEKEEPWRKLSKRQQIDRALEEESKPMSSRHHRKKRNGNGVRFFFTDVDRQKSLDIIQTLARYVHISPGVERHLMRRIETDNFIRLSLINLSRALKNENIHIWPEGIQVVIWIVIAFNHKVDSSAFLLLSQKQRKRRRDEYKRQITRLSSWLVNNRFVDKEEDWMRAHENHAKSLYKRYRSQYGKRYPLPLREEFGDHAEHVKGQSKELSDSMTVERIKAADLRGENEKGPVDPSMREAEDSMSLRGGVKELPLEFRFNFSSEVITDILNILSSQVEISDAVRPALERVMRENSFIAEDLYNLAYSVQYLGTLGSKTKIRTQIKQTLDFVLGEDVL